MSVPPANDKGPQTLASATLPRRVRRVLEQLLNTAADELEPHLSDVLADFEQQLFRLADNAPGSDPHAGQLQTLPTLRLNRADLLPRFMASVEASIAALDRHSDRDNDKVASQSHVAFKDLRLVEDTEMDEAAILRDIAARQESRASLNLQLLGQRFGVLAGTPAFDAQHMPLGPQSLCRIMQDAAQSLQVSQQARAVLYRIFERRMMSHYPQMLETINQSLAAEGVLPTLTYVPIRRRPSSGPSAETARASPASTAQSSAAAKHAERLQANAGPSAPRPPDHTHRTHTSWLGEADVDTGKAAESSAFDLLQQLLTGRRQLLGKLRSDRGAGTRRELDTGTVVDALGGLQKVLPASDTPPHNLLDIKRSLLARTRQSSGTGASLTREDNDTFELLGLLYAQIEREIRKDTPASALLRKLQLPLLRVALQDRAFFVRAQHPARQLLNAVAESGARWLGEDDVDPQMFAPLQQAVEYVVEHYDGNADVFAASNDALQQQLHALAHKAEMAERRNIEAARGKEKLEIAKQRAADTIKDLVGDQRLPRFVRALLNQAWADVLTLTLLRHGAGSKQWRQQLETSQRIVATCARPSGAPEPDLAVLIERALSQVGYHTEEANVIARRLTSALDDDGEDPASRTELAMKLKARARLGENTVVPRKRNLAPRTPDEQAQYDRLQATPDGTWIEFTINQQGDSVRRRLSWRSPDTDNALFVNQRGQRIGEQSLDSVARLLARGQARIVSAARGHLVDRAWQATLSALRSFAGHGDDGHVEDGPGDGWHDDTQGGNPPDGLAEGSPHNSAAADGGQDPSGAAS